MKKKRYVIISKGLSVVAARELGINKFMLRKRSFSKKSNAEEYLEKLPYSLQREHKVVKK